MSQPIPAEFWDARFSEEGHAYGTRASRLLLGFRDLLTPGKTALVPGAGEGRDAVFLAKCGLDVTAVDISAAGIAKTKALADEALVDMLLVQADLMQWDWPVGTFDVVAAMFMHAPSEARPGLHHRMLAALKPGGLLFLEGFTKDQLSFQARYNSGGPPVADMLFAPEEIGADFNAARPVAFWTGVEHLDEGKYHTGPAALIRVVYARKDEADG